MNKYRNIRCGCYDSRKEALRARELHFLEQAGEIHGLREQVRYELIEPQYEVVERIGKNGKRLKDGKRLLERQVYYVADFVYKDKSGATVVEDVKGVRTDAYKIKRKLMLKIYGIRIKET